jgi:hypothetical protein
MYPALPDRSRGHLVFISSDRAHAPDPQEGTALRSFALRSTRTLVCGIAQRLRFGLGMSVLATLILCTTHPNRNPSLTHRRINMALQGSGTEPLQCGKPLGLTQHGYPASTRSLSSLPVSAAAVRALRWSESRAWQSGSSYRFRSIDRRGRYGLIDRIPTFWRVSSETSSCVYIHRLETPTYRGRYGTTELHNLTGDETQYACLPRIDIVSRNTYYPCGTLTAGSQPPFT